MEALPLAMRQIRLRSLHFWLCGTRIALQILRQFLPKIFLAEYLCLTFSESDTSGPRGFITAESKPELR